MSLEIKCQTISLITNLQLHLSASFYHNVGNTDLDYLHKGDENEIIHHFWNIWRVIISQFFLFLLIHLTMHLWMFPLFLYCFIQQSVKKVVLVYKKGLKSKSNILFEFFEPWLYLTFDILFFNILLNNKVTVVSTIFFTVLRQTVKNSKMKF